METKKQVRSYLKKHRVLVLRGFSSSNISGLRYIPKLEILYVKFKSGGIYAYFDVARETFLNLASAESIGKFIRTEIETHETLRLN